MKKKDDKVRFAIIMLIVVCVVLTMMILVVYQLSDNRIDQLEQRFETFQNQFEWKCVETFNDTTRVFFKNRQEAIIKCVDDCPYANLDNTFACADKCLIKYDERGGTPFYEETNNIICVKYQVVGEIIDENN